MGVNAKRMAEIDFYLSKENLEKYLPIYSANYIATKLFLPDFKTSAGTVIDRAKILNIKTHDVSSATRLKSTQKFKKKSMIAKYGCENVSQHDLIKLKKEQSAIKKYGCRNVFQAEEIKKKSKETLMSKYGVDHVIQLPNFKRNNGSISKKHKEIYNYLVNLGYKCKNEYIFTKYNDYYKRIYAPRADIVILDKKIAIEYNGDLWHANPKMYKENDIITRWGGPIAAKDIWNKDKCKKEHIESFGYKVIYIWQTDYTKSKNKILKELLDEINKN